MTHLLRTASLAALLAATTAATASAHTSVYTSETKTTTGTPATLVDGPVNYLVSNHGYNVVLRESNGVTGGGVLNYKVLPSAWRSAQTKATLLATATGAQPHATCQGLAQLDEAAVLAWQESDPFYAYVPWQATASGLGDETEVANWVKVVKDATGVDLATTPSPQTACTNLGGTYAPADATQSTGAALSAGDIALVADPLKAQIESYKTQLATEKTRADQATASLKAASSLLTVKVVGDSTLAALTGDGIKAQVTGSPNVLIEVLLTVTKKLQSAKHLPTRTLATATVRLDGAGNGTVTLKPSAKSTKALKLAGKGLATSVTARVAVTTTTPTTLG